MTYLELVNEVLVRLRESTVATVGQTAYSRLIGLYVNDAKRQVEDAWDWEALSVTLPVSVVAGTTTYVVTGLGVRQKNVTINCVTTGHETPIRNVPAKWIENQQQLSTVQNSAPTYYAWAGTNGTDSKIEIFPTPDSAYTLNVNATVPQVNLTNDTDTLSIPYEAVVAGAFARALVERGEDGGLSSGEAYGLYKGILADQISLEAHRAIENDCWEAV